MLYWLDRNTLLILSSASLLAVLCLSPLAAKFPLNIIAAGAGVANTMFHELGHSIAGWLMGIPNVPAILTVFGREAGCGGVTLPFGHSWFVLGLVLLGLGYYAYHLHERLSPWFPAVITLILFIVLANIFQFTIGIFTLMGHFGAVLMGGFFAYRGWLNLDARNRYERWLNSFLGFYLIFANGVFGYGLWRDPIIRDAYIDAPTPGRNFHDLKEVTYHITWWSLEGVALALMIVSILTFLAAFGIAAYIMAGRQDAWADAQR